MMLRNVLFLIAFGLSSTTLAGNQTTLPGQLGPYPVSITSHEIVTDRWDPLAPTTEKRRLMVSVYRPLTNLKSCPSISYLPYMAPATLARWDEYLNQEFGLPGDMLTRIRVESCNAPNASTASNQEAPLLVFSPGSGGPRFIYTSFNQAIASSGYTVIAVDHTYDSLIVEFPDGTTALRNTLWDFIKFNSTPNADAASAPFVPVRAADMTSALDAVQAGRIPGLEAYAKKNKPLKAIAYGQSLGGNSAIAAVEQDSRFIGGMDWDSNFYDPQVRNTSISIPVALMASQQRWDSGRLTETWNDIWKQLKGWNVAFGVNNTMHVSNTDVPLIVDTLGLRTASFNQSFGTISGKRVQNIVWSYSLSFFDFVFKGKTPTLLQGPSPKYPDVFFLRKPQ